jgi:hypothetical protein
LGEGEVGAALHPALEVVLFLRLPGEWLGRDSKCRRAGWDVPDQRPGSDAGRSSLSAGDAGQCGEGHSEPEPAWTERLHYEGFRAGQGHVITQGGR